MDDGSLQSLLGLVFVGLGWLHFTRRDHEAETRSYYVGGASLGPRLRTVSALAELTAGCVLLLTV